MSQRRCPDCSARWPSRGNRWCGACGAALVPEPDVDRTGRSRRWARAIGGALAVAGLAAVLTVAIVRSGGIEDGAGPTLDAEVGGEVELPSDDALETAVPMICEPEDCALWRAPVPTSGELRWSADVIVHVDDELVLALDAATGQARWSAPLPGPEREGTASASVVHLVGDRLVLGYSAGNDDDASRVLVFDTADGSLVLDEDVDLVRRVFALGWRDGRVLVFGTATSSLLFQGSPRTLLLPLADGGGPPDWLLDGVSIPDFDLQQEPLLVRSEGTLERIDVGSGEVIWSHPAVDDVRAPDGQRLLVPPGRDRVIRIDAATGEVLGEVAVAHVDALAAVGPWIGASVDGDLHVLDDAARQPDAAPLFVRSGTPDNLDALEIDDVVVTAWGDDGDPLVEVLVHRRDDGTTLQQLDVEVVAGPAPLSLTPSEDDPAARSQQERLVVVRVDGGATLALIDVALGTLSRQVRLAPTDALEGADDVVGHDGVVVVQRGTGATLYGPDGGVRVDGATTIEVSDAVVLARGAAGLLRVDRSLLDARGP